MWNCGGGFIGKLAAILDSYGDADIIIIVETHLPGDSVAPNIPGYSTWLHCRTGARRSSGGIAVLVHERLTARVSPWRAGGQHAPSPHHFWLRIEAPALRRPLFLASAYLPPYRSRPYGLQGPGELADFFCQLGDEVAAAKAVPGGADVLVAGDLNAHTGTRQDSADHSAILQAALCEAAEEILAPCAQQDPGFVPPARASTCGATVCPQGSAVLDLCITTGLLIFNGRVEGDMEGSPTCFTGHTPTLIDYALGCADLLAQAAELRVLPPVPEYIGHRPVQLVLTGVAAAPAQQPGPDGGGGCSGGEESGGGAPSFAPLLRITPDGLDEFTSALQQPATLAGLEALADSAGSDPLQATSQLHSLLYDTAAAVFPPASSQAPGQRAHRSSTHLRRQHQPWFDAECQAARQHIRQLVLADLRQHPGRPSTHLARQALREASNRYTALRRRKAAAWQRQRGTAIIHLHRKDPRKFFKRWKKRNPDNPIDAATWLRHFTKLQLKRMFKAIGPHPPADTSAAGSSPPAADAELDGDITPADVASSLGKLSPSAACLGPLKATLIKAGKGVLVPVLARLFTALFRAGLFPPAWALGAISPILKKGDITDPNNYRGITVGHVLGKLYATVINDRLTTWLETRGKRANGQAGFRKNHQTVDNCFILRALVERARARGVKLYICAVDFEKAFDSVDRPLLWAALQRAGVGGCMLQAIQSMYADVPVCVKTGSGLSSCFQSVLGVKQGCPLSPLLFGVFLDDFEVLLQQELGAAAALPTLAGRTVPPFLFADDMLLVSATPAGLRRQLDYLQTYCDAKKLTVNTAKTQVMILRPGGGSGRAAADDSFSYAGRPLEVVNSLKYLGLTFAQLSKQRGFAGCADVLAVAGRKAMFATRRRAWELGACLVEHQCMLFDIFVKPVLSYGCEVWGVDLLASADCASERVHRWFCRQVQGLPKQVTAAVSLAELGRWPLHLFWVQQLARFWNRLLSMDAEPDRLLRWAFLDNLELMREGADLAAGSPCWCRKWFTYLQSTPTDTGTIVWLTPLREGDLVERATKAYIHQAMQPSAQPTATTAATVTAATTSATAPARGPTTDNGLRARSPPARYINERGWTTAAATATTTTTPPPDCCSTNKFCYYLSHIRGSLPLGVPAPHLLAATDSRHRINLSRFRASCHHLRIERERYLPEAVKAPRHERTCLACASPSVEDEFHAIFHCPLYDDLRWEFADLFDPQLPQSTTCFLSQDQNRIAAYIHKCSVLRCLTRA